MTLFLLVLAFVLFVVAAILAWVPLPRPFWAALACAGLAAWVLADLLAAGAFHP